MFSYMAHGFLGTVPGHNPLTDAAEIAQGTAIGPRLAAFGWDAVPGITPYGIIWTQIEINIMRVSGGSVLLALFLMKAVVLAASLGTAVAIGHFLDRADPAARQLGVLAYLWNPLILIEFAAEGHNDALMILCAVVALAACASNQPAVSVFAQLCGVLTKYVSVLFAPAQLVYLWRTRRSAGRLIVEVLFSALVAGAIAAALYAPLWAGIHTFDGIAQRATLPTGSASPSGAIDWILRHLPLSSATARITMASVSLPVLAFIAWISLKVRDARSLARAFAWTSVAYVLVASPDYWPWYTCMPVALLIVADTDRYLGLILMMSVVARLGAPLDLLRDHGLLTMEQSKGGATGLGTTLPLVMVLIWLVWRGRGNRPLQPWSIYRIAHAIRQRAMRRAFGTRRPDAGEGHASAP
jgi:hypothetical protein